MHTPVKIGGKGSSGTLGLWHQHNLNILLRHSLRHHVDI